MAEKKKRKRKLKKEVVQLLTGLAVILAIVLGIIVFKSVKRFNYYESLDEVILTISNNSVSNCQINITLGEIAYYVAEVEEVGQQTALVYNSKNPLEYWNLYMNENMTENSGYISDIAKRSVVTYCTRDNVYNLEMILNGYMPDEEIMAEIEYDAEVAYNHLTKRQKECMGLDLEQYKKVYIKEKKAHEYMIYMAKQENTSALESIVLKYDVGGYYYDSLINNYTTKLNEALWENIRVGHVTVN